MVLTKSKSTIYYLEHLYNTTDYGVDECVNNNFIRYLKQKKIISMIIYNELHMSQTYAMKM